MVIIDDDVPLPPDFDFHVEELDSSPDIASYGYGITAVTPTDPETGESPFSLLVAHQDLECANTFPAACMSHDCLFGCLKHATPKL